VDSTDRRTFELGPERRRGSWVDGLRAGPIPPSGAASPAVHQSMKGNRSTNTSPEVALRSALHRAGCRYRKNYKISVDGATVRPDIVFPHRRVAVFVDGCFWHSCPVHGRRPATNSEYWRAKLGRNQERDQLVNARLAAADWVVIRIWAHSLAGTDLELSVVEVRHALNRRQPKTCEP